MVILKYSLSYKKYWEFYRIQIFTVVFKNVRLESVQKLGFITHLQGQFLYSLEIQD